MSLDWLVNKGVRAAERRTVGGEQPSGSCSIQATLKLSISKSPLKTLLFFHPHFASFLSDPSLSLLLCLLVYFCFTHPILQALFYPRITSLVL